MKIKAEFPTPKTAKTYTEKELHKDAPDGVYAPQMGTYRAVVCTYFSQRCVLYVSGSVLEPMSDASNAPTYTPTNETMSIVFSKE